jgi:hypothetical protein
MFFSFQERMPAAATYAAVQHRFIILYGSNVSSGK